MTEADLAALRAQLMDHEGLRLRPYTDTVGKLTIGVGRNLTDTGITSAEAMTLHDRECDSPHRDDAAGDGDRSLLRWSADVSLAGP